MINHTHIFNDYLKPLAACPNWKGRFSLGQARADGREACASLYDGGFFYSIIFLIDSLTKYCSWPQPGLQLVFGSSSLPWVREEQDSLPGRGRHKGSAIPVAPGHYRERASIWWSSGLGPNVLSTQEAVDPFRGFCHSLRKVDKK